ncbi:hypothetical protein J3F83DRAFT_613844 [Trichoderma novae-zelandiae]
MGNTPSSEAPRKASQKLSKPRAASHGALPRPRNLTGAAASSSTRISESYLAASIPFSARNSQCVSGGGNAAPEPYVERLYEPSRRLSRRESEYMRSPVLPESPITDSRSHSFHATSAASKRTHRSSVIQDDAERPLARTQSWHGNRMERGRSMQAEMLQLYASQQLPRTSSEFLQELQVAAMNSQMGMHQSPSPSPSQSHIRDRRASSVAAASIARTASDLSIYAPVRRRSVIQTPGVATRPRRDDMLSIPDRSTARNSQPVFGDDQYGPKPNSKAAKHLSMPLMNMGFGPLERAVTPCESDYKQLGGIKFGSLKITNGSPPSSPQEKIKQHQQESSIELPSGAVPEDSGLELNMARRKNRHTVVGARESRALASVTAFSLADKASQRPSQTEKPPLDDLMPSPLSKVPSPLMRYVVDMEDNEVASGKGIGVWRSNSGFSSTTSSASSRTNSKTDSGYSSNVSERSFPSSSITDGSSYMSQSQTRRPTLEQPTMTPLISSIDSMKKSRQLYKPFVRLERDKAGASSNDMAKEVTASGSVFVRPKVRRHEKHYYMASSPGLPLHRMDASTATLNTILSVDLTSDNAAAVEVEVVVNDSKSLKKRRSLRKVAEAATSRMPSLGLSRRKSATGNMSAGSLSKADAEKRRRAMSLVNGNPSVAASSSNPATLTQPPGISNRQAKGSSLKDRASAPELRVAIPDNAQFNRKASNRSSSTVGTPSPRTPRPRGIMDSGVPPPIPPQFRAPAFNGPSIKSADWPLAQPHRSWDGSQLQAPGGHAQAAQNVRRSTHGALDSPVSPRHSRPARSNPPTYRGVRM